MTGRRSLAEENLRDICGPGNMDQHSFVESVVKEFKNYELEDQLIMLEAIVADLRQESLIRLEDLGIKARAIETFVGGLPSFPENLK